MKPDWKVCCLNDLLAIPITNGVFNDPKLVGKGYRLINVVDLYSEPFIKPHNLNLLNVEPKDVEKYRVEKGDLLFTRSSLKAEGIAHCNMLTSDEDNILFECHLMRVRTKKEIAEPHFLRLFCLTKSARKYFITHAKATTMTTIDQATLGNLPVLLPTIDEQKKIVNYVSRWEQAIELTEHLIFEKQEQRKWLGQQLLTGKIRLKKWQQNQEKRKTPFGNIPVDWEYLPLETLAVEINKKNVNDLALPVLSCTKHRGLVESLEYFKRKVFSENLKTYKIVKRGQFAYVLKITETSRYFR